MAKWSLAEIRRNWIEIRHTGQSTPLLDDVGFLLERLGAKDEPDPELGYTPPMVCTTGDEEIFAHCGDCGTPLGSIRPDGRIDTFFLNWERHTMTEHDGG